MSAPIDLMSSSMGEPPAPAPAPPPAPMPATMEHATDLPPSSSASSPSAPSGVRTRPPRSTKGLAKAMRVDQADLPARRAAACVLEVLAGVRSPEDAATTLGLSLQGYYLMEERALRGLVEACVSQPGARGRQPDLSKKLEEVHRRCAELEREVQRHQALLRTAQRASGLATEASARRSAHASSARLVKEASATTRSRSKGRRPRVRALRAVAALRGNVEAGAAPGAAGASPPASAASPAVAT